MSSFASTLTASPAPAPAPVPSSLLLPTPRIPLLPGVFLPAPGTIRPLLLSLLLFFCALAQPLRAQTFSVSSTADRVNPNLSCRPTEGHAKLPKVTK